MRRYLIVMEKSENAYCAYTPDLPGCVAVGKTIEDAEEAVLEALREHIKGLETDGQPVPKTASLAEYVLVKDDM